MSAEKSKFSSFYILRPLAKEALFSHHSSSELFRSRFVANKVKLELFMVPVCTFRS